MQLRLQLARIMILNLLNLYSLIWALFGKINGMTARLGQIRNFSQDNGSITLDPPITTTKAAPIVTQAPLTSTIPTTTIQSITETIFSRIAEIVNLTTTTEKPTENYDYYNTNYFDADETTVKASSTVETSTGQSLSNFTESLFDSTDIFYDNEFGNLTDFYSNSTSDLIENSNFNMSNIINDSFASNFTNSVFNYTNVEPIVSAYQGVQYSFLTQEPSAFINMELLNMSTKIELRKLCWETMFGQELVKLTVMDLVRTI